MKEIRKVIKKEMWSSFWWTFWNLFFFIFDGYCLIKDMLKGNLWGVAFWVILTTLMGRYLYKSAYSFGLSAAILFKLKNVEKIMKDQGMSIELGTLGEPIKTDPDAVLEITPHEEIK